MLGGCARSGKAAWPPCRGNQRYPVNRTPQKNRVQPHAGALDAQDLGQRRAPDLELALVRLARAYSALDRAGAAERARGASRRGARTMRRPRRPPRSRPGDGAAGEMAAGPAHGAAAACPRCWRPSSARRGASRSARVLGGVAGVVGVLLVGGDRLVLDAVDWAGSPPRSANSAGATETSAATARRRRRPALAAQRAATAPAATPSTETSWNGSRASGSAALDQRITAIASPRRATPRTPGTPSTARRRGFCPRRP